MILFDMLCYSMIFRGQGLALLTGFAKVPWLHLLSAQTIDIQILIELAVNCLSHHLWSHLLRCLLIICARCITAHFFVHFVNAFIIHATTVPTRTHVHFIVNELLDVFGRVQNVNHGRIESSALGVGEEDIGAHGETCHPNARLRELLWLLSFIDFLFFLRFFLYFCHRSSNSYVSTANLLNVLLWILQKCLSAYHFLDANNVFNHWYGSL